HRPGEGGQPARQQPRGHRPGETPSHQPRHQQKKGQGGRREPLHRPVEARPVAVDPTTKPPEERVGQILSAFSPSRFNRFRR
ncbi:MAG: hypothetical protein WAM82_03665, partial [Thermoanaerobaculia bacterium]